MNGLDLFSGIGGLALALDGMVKPIAYCEIDRYAQAVLLSRMSDRRIALAPIWDDVRTLRGHDLPDIEIIYGGFPCQDISCAGNGAGLGGERSGLFFHIARLVSETNPRFVFLENVPAIRTRGLNGVVQTLTELGYDCRWTVVSAAEVGAPHLRKRWFLLAHARSEFLRDESGRRGRPTGASEAVARDHGEQKSLAHAASPKLKRERAEPSGQSDGPSDSGSNVANPLREGPLSSAQAGIHCGEESARPRHEQFGGLSWWSIEPNVGRVANGVPARVDRLRGLGNAVVPLQAKVAFERLIGIGD
jgi:DNA (cytosine-5)-methyltransferase 1